MNQICTPHSALVLVDVQKGFDEPRWGKRNNPNAEDNIVKLLSAWRSHDLPIVHVQHCSVDPDSPLRPDRAGNAFKDDAAPQGSEPIFKKEVNSAFIGTELEAFLREHTITRLVFVGITTDHCVSTSVRMSANLGFDTYIVSDGTHTFERTAPDGTVFNADLVHAVSLASLRDEFAKVITTEEILRDFAQ